MTRCVQLGRRYFLPQRRMQSKLPNGAFSAVNSSPHRDRAQFPERFRVRKARIFRVFQIGLILKGVHSVLEIIGGHSAAGRQPGVHVARRKTCLRRRNC